eukprot:TRINITY_DN1091_c0_g1_i1.p1 TRINITY_DN1091_c0_g1~~TRINITY_DN1091_c0_g1_i1.p1  ORF type:complete len:246 (-),score=48.88 TRINITY_DN1091_c0_g1_i1:41-778(-)
MAMDASKVTAALEEWVAREQPFPAYEPPNGKLKHGRRVFFLRRTSSDAGTVHQGRPSSWHELEQKVQAMDEKEEMITEIDLTNLDTGTSTSAGSRMRRLGGTVVPRPSASSNRFRPSNSADRSTSRGEAGTAASCTSDTGSTPLFDPLGPSSCSSNANVGQTDEQLPPGTGEAGDGSSGNKQPYDSKTSGRRRDMDYPACLERGGADVYPQSRDGAAAEGGSLQSPCKQSLFRILSLRSPKKNHW